MKKLGKIYLIVCLTVFSFSNRVYAAASCESVVGSSIVDFIVDIFNMVKWISLALCVALSMLDFFKAIGKDDELPKVAQKFVKRLIAVVVLFILPILLNWVLDISGIEHGGTCIPTE